MPPENIRKPKGFLIFSGGKEKQHRAVTGQKHLWNISPLIKLYCHKVRKVFPNILEIFLPNNIVINILTIIAFQKRVAYQSL